MKWVDKIYIISLNNTSFRRDNIWNDLLSAGFDSKKIEWVDAINGNDLDIHKLLDDSVIDSKFRDPNGLLTKSIYGCSLSHQKVYQRFLETDENIKTALVLEDDASLTHTALRTLITGSPAYDFLVEDVTNIDWGVIQIGGVDKHMEYVEDDTLNTKIIKKAKFPINGWAAHSYIINKVGAKKLIESNTPIQYAADTNIHLSDVNLFTTVVSYFLQKVGKYDSWLVRHIENKVNRYVLYELDEYGLEFQSKTFNGDLIKKEQHITAPMYGMTVSKSIKPKLINFETFEASNGDLIEDWTTIYLKI